MGCISLFCKMLAIWPYLAIVASMGGYRIVCSCLGVIISFTCYQPSNTLIHLQCITTDTLPIMLPIPQDLVNLQCVTTCMDQGSTQYTQFLHIFIFKRIQDLHFQKNTSTCFATFLPSSLINYCQF